MHSLFAVNGYFLLQSLGWSILNSFVQAGLLWIIWQMVITPGTRCSSAIRHILSLLFVFASFVFFIFIIIETYISLSSPGLPSSLFHPSLFFINPLQITKWLPFLSYIYLFLLFFYLFRFIYSYRKTVSFRKENLLKAPVDLFSFTEKTAQQLGIKKNILVWMSEQVDVPAVIGFFKPVILLPVAIINHLNTDQLEAVLLHELAHIKRNDYLVNLLQSIVETILFFNPFVLLLSNDAKKERENCCDDWVIHFNYNKHQYANALLILEEKRRQYLLLAMAATNKKEFLLYRIKRLFKSEPQMKFNLLQKTLAGIIAFVLFSGITCLLLFPLAKDNSLLTKKTEITKVVPGNAPSVVIRPTKKQETAAVEDIHPVKINARVRLLKKSLQNNFDSNDYTLAYINPELLKNKTLPSLPVIPVADKEQLSSKQYYIKVEEQQSGKKEVNVYYFELEKKDGKPEVKPILLLKQNIPGTQINKPENCKDSTAVRITS